MKNTMGQQKSNGLYVAARQIANQRIVMNLVGGMMSKDYNAIDGLIKQTRECVTEAYNKGYKDGYKDGQVVTVEVYVEDYDVEERNGN